MFVRFGFLVVLWMLAASATNVALAEECHTGVTGGVFGSGSKICRGSSDNAPSREDDDEPREDDHLDSGLFGTRPDPGYTWVYPGGKSLAVRWAPRMLHGDHPHVEAANEEGYWQPEDGYRWETPQQPLRTWRVRWQPGTALRSNRNVVAGNKEGEWYPRDGYVWVVNPPVPGDLRVRWVPGRQSLIYPNVVAASVEDSWIPADGYQWLDRKNLRAAPDPPEAPLPEPLTDRWGAGNGFIGGTGWRVAFAVPRNATRAQRRQAEASFHRQSDRAREAFGKKYDEAVDLDRYDFAIGIAASTNEFLDLGGRVLLDQLAQGRATPALQTEYNWLKEKDFDELGCHSNGAMICLAALQNGHITARNVVLYGPQITVESLRMWERLVRRGRVGSIRMLINRHDPVPPLSLLASASNGPYGPLLSHLAALPLLFSTDAMRMAVQFTAPSIHVATFDCASSIQSLECHDMTRYSAAR